MKPNHNPYIFIKFNLFKNIRLYYLFKYLNFILIYARVRFIEGKKLETNSIEF